MGTLKPLYDAAKTADEKVASIVSQMTAAFDKETDEGNAEAMAMRADLDAARAEAEEANLAYISARDVSADSDENARKFVPVSETAGKPNQKTRAEFEALGPAERMDWALKGGLIVEG